ncbi:MAG: glycoside hydrolase family 2 TIM barrel-domain containing protein [Clostridiaceae bacterium]|nr:glycoside hydrolase family 2 TIM barrel-domain containing protein [Clostridiaceae bacterium]
MMDTRETLNGRWELYYGEDDGRRYSSGGVAAEAGYRHIAASVPGNVELDLMAAGLEPDPFLGENVLLYEQYEYNNWLFERTFRPDPEQKGRRPVLVLHGVNTFAAVYLNGVCLGETDNMLIAHEFDLTASLLWDQENTLAVFIRSAMNEARRYDYPAAFHGSEQSDEITRLRMPPHSFGWDIMPRLLSAGLWRDVEIQYHDAERLKDLYLCTRNIQPGQADLSFSYTFESSCPRLPIYRITLEGRCGGSTFSAEQETHFISNHMNIRVDRPMLWWPRGYGEPYLYQVEVSLWQGDRLCDRRSFRFGIRTATVDACFELTQKQRFTVLVNNEPIFIRGSNWVPLSALHSLDLSRVDRAIDLVCGCGCNALRCWGGNVYESDRFYDLCDEKGLLVWQDFAMACSGQPSDDAFARAIEQEATFIIKRLRNHCCLLLWAGDNEIDACVYQQFPKGIARYSRTTREVLPRVIAAHDPMRFYLPSSPYMPEDYDCDAQGPEQHLWGPRDDFKGDFYRLNQALFASEIGYHGCPEKKSLQRFISPDELWPNAGSRQWLVHNSEKPLYRRGYNRNELMAKQAAILFGAAPEKLEDFVLASQISQAEAKKFFIEQFRMQKGRKSGLIWWNVLDGWPQISDAVVDYYFTPKLAYSIIMRSQQDVQLMIGEYRSWAYPIVAVNDTMRPVAGQYRVYRADNGQTAAEGSFSLTANGRADLAELKANPSVQELYILEWRFDGQIKTNHYLAGRAPFKLQDFRRWLPMIAALPPTFYLPDILSE